MKIFFKNEMTLKLFIGILFLFFFMNLLSLLNDFNLVKATKSYKINGNFIDKVNVLKNNKIIDLYRQKEIASKNHKLILHITDFNDSNTKDSVLSYKFYRKKCALWPSFELVLAIDFKKNKLKEIGKTFFKRWSGNLNPEDYGKTINDIGVSADYFGKLHFFFDVGSYELVYLGSTYNFDSSGYFYDMEKACLSHLELIFWLEL